MSSRRAPRGRTTAGFRNLLTSLGDTFWLLPGALVVLGVIGGLGMVAIDRSGAVPHWLIAGPWLYSGRATGARTLLGAVASSTIGVAGAVFSITIAALSLAAGQMGPRVIAAIKADTLSLTAWQLGMYGFMAFAYFYLFGALLGVRLQANMAEFWFMMQIAMMCGFLTAYPVNWWLIQSGIKEKM